MRRALLVALPLLGVSLATGVSAWQESAPQVPDLVTADVVRVVGPPRGRLLSGDELDARTEEVGGLLRCPVCQGLSVADSPAGMAQKMKGQVRELLAAGFDEEQVQAYFERSYGEFVRLDPPLRGVNWLVWLAPLIGLIAGGLVVALTLRRPRRAAAAQQAPAEAAQADRDLPGPDTLPDDPELAEYVLKVREQAYGWPGGVSPEKGSS